MHWRFIRWPAQPFSTCGKKSVAAFVASTPSTQERIQRFHRLQRAPRRSNLRRGCGIFNPDIAMYFLSFQTLVLGALAMQSGLSNAASGDKTPPVHCTIHSPSTGSFYDLRALLALQPGSDKISKNSRTKNWQAQGHDYSYNFTLNICAPVIEPPEKVVGVDETHLQNVMAYYVKGEKTYSIG
jgi:hypothetical protein